MRAAVLATLLVISTTAHAAWQDEPGAKLRWLDKVTARTGVVELHNDESAKYGDLVIRVKSCRAQDPLEGADSAAFLQIWEARKNEDPEWVYSGWMFASSPGIAAMDHPVYDVWVLGCLGRANAPAQSTEAQAEKLPTAEEAEAAEATDRTEDGEAVEDTEAVPVDQTTIPAEDAASVTQDIPTDEEASPGTEEPSVDTEMQNEQAGEAARATDMDAPYQPAPVAPQTPASSGPDWDAPFNGYTRPQ